MNFKEQSRLGNASGVVDAHLHVHGFSSGIVFYESINKPTCLEIC